MDSFLPIEISASGLDAQRMRMTTIASNLANVDSTRTTDGEGPYQRRDVSLQAQQLQFDDLLGIELGAQGDPVLNLLRGVSAKGVIDQSAEPRRAHQPGHPDADENGWVTYPGINVITEMANMMAASRSYEANLAAIRTSVSMIESAMRITQG